MTSFTQPSSSSCSSGQALAAPVSRVSAGACVLVLASALSLVACQKSEPAPDPGLKPSLAANAQASAGSNVPAGGGQAGGAAAAGAEPAAGGTAGATGAGGPGKANNAGAAGQNAGTGSGQAAGPGAAGGSGAPGAGGAGGAAGGQGATPPGAAASAPPVSVTLVVARKRDLPIQLEGTGTAAPVLTVDLRAQVTSMVRQVHVREGQFVKAGQLLFTLDATADQANVARLNAQLARDEAAAADARRQLQRSRELQAQNFVSQGAVDSAQTLVDTQTAAVAASKAAVSAGKVPLSYARIVAPHGGRVGAINLFAGSSVKANDTPLVTITKLDPIDVAFAVPQRYLGDVLKASQGEGAAVTALLPDGGTPLQGRLVFVDSSVDATSGTVKVKARFANGENKLWPGAFVRASVTVKNISDAVVIPLGAVIQSPRGPMVYASVEGKAVPRPLEVLATVGEDAAVSGVRPGERVVLDGRQNVRPGSTLIERQREAGGRGAGGGQRGQGGPGGGAGGGGRAGAASGAASGAMPGPSGGAGGGAGAGGGGSGGGRDASAEPGGAPNVAATAAANSAPSAASGSRSKP